ncbi:dTMP kinase [Haematospirillum jordaniae]|uniref:Thymidylate kinase n=1 Tax=Haematospirillum jordaniae TaxID=1549855 RepID=A0A143DGF5_9PROT|nr:dTMP kinase [Haematospirillum jordaniae]AMW35198.1 thymidylate kinase [Haematospirillum jordaniae]NKD45652.1 dTMP kinase [Haematospirillum jordaniae]NKD56405.1 dTMP kinase [Haematospirillum jordaniae]NKD58463.1 dTMP kinase [Haematospirillum jordaniae]NKD66368.1 dTMP kinase [Haematospirillum jordaniae]
MISARFITFEGGEGSGKSTQIRLLADFLRQKGIGVAMTREPGGAPGAEEIRALLVRGEASRWDPVSEALLLYAARRNHVLQTIRPALMAGQWVLCDRFNDSTLAYQGVGHGLDPAFLDTLFQVSAEDTRPDLTFLLDIDPCVGLSRAERRGDADNRFESMHLSFHVRLREGFLSLAAKDQKRFRIIDAARSVDQVHQDIIKALGGLLTL